MSFRRIRLFSRENRETGRYTVWNRDRPAHADPERPARVGMTAQEAMDLAQKIMDEMARRFSDNDQSRKE